MRKVIVFTQETCAPCKILKEELNKEHIEYQELDMNKADDYTLELATRLKIRRAPTMIVETDDGYTYPGFKTVSELKDFLGL